VAFEESLDRILGIGVEVAEMWRTDPSWVRKVIHEFNERGMDSLRPRYRGGRPRRITTDQRQRIVSVAGARPDTHGIPLTRRSLPRPAAQLAGEGIDVSPRHVGTLLAEAGLSFQRTRTWKASPDPDYEEKAARILASTTTVVPAPATCSAPTTFTPTGSGSGCARNGPAATCSASCARDPARLPGPATDLLDPGQPLRQLGAADPRLRSRQDWDAFGYALAQHIRYRNSDHRDRRIAAAEAKHRIAA
jgi:transposase